MTERELRQYRKIKKEIEDLERRIEKEEEKEEQIVKGVVKGSSKRFPYLNTRMSVDIYEPVQYDKSCKLIKKMSDKVMELQKAAEQIEDFIETIKDSEVRQILRYRFIDGLTQQEIAMLLHMDQSNVSRKIRTALNVA